MTHVPQTSAVAQQLPPHILALRGMHVELVLVNDGVEAGAVEIDEDGGGWITATLYSTFEGYVKEVGVFEDSQRVYLEFDFSDSDEDDYVLRVYHDHIVRGRSYREGAFSELLDFIEGLQTSDPELADQLRFFLDLSFF